MARPRTPTPRKRPSQARGRATVEAILEATARILVDEGYEKATTNHVAEVAGVSIGSLYQYFPNKEALVGELLERHESRMLDQLAGMMTELAGAPIDEAVRTYVRAMLELHRQTPKLHRVLTQQIPIFYDLGRIRDFQARAEVVVRAFLEVHEARIRPTNLDHAAFVLVTAVESVTHAAVVDRPKMLADPGFETEIVELILRYLGVSEGRPGRRSRARRA